MKIINDACMQALGSYERRRMLYIGLGTSMGTVVLGGGNAKKLDSLPEKCRRGANEMAYVG